MVAGTCMGPVDHLRKALVEDVGDQAGLATPGDTGDANQATKRDGDIHIPEVVSARATDRHHLAIPGTACKWAGNDPPSGQVRTGQGIRVGHDLGWCAGGDDAPAMFTGTRADIDNPVGGADGVLVVFHHKQGVAEVT